MKDKKCPFAIMARGHLRAEESLCLESNCAIWNANKCAILAIAEKGVAPLRATGVLYQDDKATKMAKING